MAVGEELLACRCWQQAGLHGPPATYAWYKRKSPAVLERTHAFLERELRLVGLELGDGSGGAAQQSVCIALLESVSDSA